MNTISPNDLQKAAKTLPPAPEIFGKLGKLLKDPDTGLDDISDLVNTDSSLTVSVLRLSNSALFAGGDSIDTLCEAINRIGFHELYKLVGMAASSQVFSKRNVTYGIEGSRLWENSLACGLAMEELARAIGVDHQEAYTLGLLRSMGKMVIDLCATKLSGYPTYPDNAEPPLIEWEENNFGITSAIVAGFILASWNFPSDTATTIQYQYQPEESPTIEPQAYLLNIANSVAEGIGKGLKGESTYWKDRDDYAVSLGLSSEDLAEIGEKVTESLGRVVASVAV